MSNCGVYEIRNISTGTRYIGSSSAIQNRITQHKAMLSRGRHHSVSLQRAWNKYGSESFVFRAIAILEECERLPTEQRLLDIEHSGKTYNVSKDAVAWMKGRKHTDEWKEKAAKWRLGNKSKTGMPGPWSKENPPPSLQKLIAVSRNPSLETRAKMREARIGKPPANKGKKGPPVSVETRAILAEKAKELWRKRKAGELPYPPNCNKEKDHFVKY